MEFCFSKVTNSRLMGSLGLIISWKIEDDTLTQFFLLDSEGLGIADYVSYKNIDSKMFYKEQERLMGGLGSDKIQLTEEEALFLINHFGNKNRRYLKMLPGKVEEYIKFIECQKKNIQIANILPKICKPINQDIEFVNYMVMRFIAWDKECMKYFVSNEDIANMNITKINGTLLKNKVKKKKENKYICEALYEDNDGYYICKLAITIEKINSDYKVKSLIVGQKEAIYDFEVFDEISKYEFLSIYDINNKDEFVEKFYNENPFLLKSELNTGILFTRFNFDNNHVKKDIYIINEDIKALYYQMNDKFFVGTYNEKDEIYINKILQLNNKEYLQINQKFEFEQNVLYEFVECESDDFEAFID